MFKKIPGNHDYVISLNSLIRTKDGYRCDLPIKNNKVSITLYNKLEIIDLNWLALLAHFEINLPNDFKSINFTDTNHKVTKSTCGKTMLFSKYIRLLNKYIIIPNFTNYAISKEGEIIDCVSLEKLNIKTEGTHYPTVFIYNPDKSIYKNELVHRLVALAWVHNKDYIEKPLVNHKNGNKNNFYYKNLEWCTYSENSIHAVNNGLRSDNRSFKVKDHTTDATTEHYSFANVCRSIGINATNSFRDKIYRKKTKLINKRYEIKLLDDNSPWLTKNELTNKVNKYTIRVIYSDGHDELFNSIVDVMKRLKIWNISYNIKEIIKVAEIKYPGIKFEVKDNFPQRKVQALKLTTGEVLEADSPARLALLTDIGKSTIVQALNKDKIYNCKGYAFRYKSDNPWLDIIDVHPNARIKIKATNSVTKEVIEFPSMDAVVIALNTSYPTAKNALNTSKKLGEWTIERI